MNPLPPTEAVRVWDPFVRIFHWSLVACVFLNFLVEEGEAPHQWIGYAASALVAARIVWGFVGSRYARFSDFFPTPTRLRRHVSALLAGKPEHHLGHNPFGALMILALTWQRMTGIGAVAGLVTGALTVIVWKQFVNLMQFFVKNLQRTDWKEKSGSISQLFRNSDLPESRMANVLLSGAVSFVQYALLTL